MLILKGRGYKMRGGGWRRRRRRRRVDIVESSLN